MFSTSAWILVGSERRVYVYTCIVQWHARSTLIQVIPEDNSDHLSLPAPVVQESDLGFACLLAVSARLLCGQFSGYFILGLGTLHVHSS